MTDDTFIEFGESEIELTALGDDEAEDCFLPPRARSKAPRRRALVARRRSLTSVFNLRCVACEHWPGGRHGCKCQCHNVCGAACRRGQHYACKQVRRLCACGCHTQVLLAS